MLYLKPYATDFIWKMLSKYKEKEQKFVYHKKIRIRDKRSEKVLSRLIPNFLSFSITLWRVHQRDKIGESCPPVIPNFCGQKLGTVFENKG